MSTFHLIEEKDSFMLSGYRGEVIVLMYQTSDGGVPLYVVQDDNTEMYFIFDSLRHLMCHLGFVDVDGGAQPLVKLTKELYENDKYLLDVIKSQISI